MEDPQLALPIALSYSTGVLICLKSHGCLNVAGWAPGFWGQEAHEERDEERDEGSERSKGSPGLVGFAIATVTFHQIESVVLLKRHGTKIWSTFS